MLAADDAESPVRASGSGAGHAVSRPSRCASRCSQPSPSPGPMSARAPRPRVPAARQIDHICAPERWAPNQDDGRAERRFPFSRRVALCRSGEVVRSVPGSFARQVTAGRS